MRIAVISDYGQRGGAAIAASRLCEGFRARGHQVGRLYCFPPGPADGTTDEAHQVADWAFLTVRFSRFLQFEAWRRIAQMKWVRVLRDGLNVVQPHVISLHNLHGAQWDIEVVRECLRHAPVIWTMHDMWPFTGSCAYAFDCKRYTTGCDKNCPRTERYPTLPARMIAAAYERRKALYGERPRLALVGPSRWITDCAAAMAKGSVPTLQISNGLDLGRFRPIPRGEAMARFGLTETGKPTLLAAAASLGDPTKGMTTLLDALKILNGRSARLLLMGDGGPDIRISGKVDVVRLGSITDESTLRMAYSAADLFVHPSHAENQPLVIAEAFACGVPVVGMPVGGVPEMAIPGETGWIAREVSAPSLAEAIGAALDARDEWPAYGVRCRAFAAAQYDIARQAVRYESAFAKMALGEPLSQEAIDAVGTTLVGLRGN